MLIYRTVETGGSMVVHSRLILCPASGVHAMVAGRTARATASGSASAEPEWENVLTGVGRRGLTPLFHTDMTAYGEIRLRTDRRLGLTDLPTE